MLSMIVIASKLSDPTIRNIENYFSLEFKKMSTNSYYGINSENKLKLSYHDDFFKIEFYKSTENDINTEQALLVSQFINNEFEEEILGIYFDKSQQNKLNTLLRDELRLLIVN
ncbi:hypothetical protein [Paenibacillus xylanexedens]|uniref:hypothetical protein n=1 Tax=Paenibacillus xylanexedens TaxID=528191 RepID=UPI0011A97387|nr:hypothetical protein [Paenibacillus xylanexedens]